MKLYTEEQVKEAFKMGHEHGTNWIHPNLHHSMQKLTPIELPSDEEIKKLELEYAINFGTNMGIGFKIGCQWIKEQILNQNK